MESNAEKFLRKLRQIEEHARALTHELPAGEARNRARLIQELVAHQRLREIEEHAGALAQALLPGLPLSRARQIRSMAAHLALQAELEKAGGHLLDAA